MTKDATVSAPHEALRTWVATARLIPSGEVVSPNDGSFGGRIAYLLADRDALAAQVERVRALTEPAHRQVASAVFDDDYQRGRAHALDDAYRLLSTSDGAV